MKVLGFDPGSRCLGFGVVEHFPGGWRHLASGTIRLNPRRPLSERLEAIHHATSALLALHAPDLVAVEECFVARNARAALVLGQVRGVLLLAIRQAGVPSCELAPRAVKLAAVGNGGADKKQVQYMIPRLLESCPGVLEEDAADALAVAWCGANRSQAPQV